MGSSTQFQQELRYRLRTATLPLGEFYYMDCTTSSGTLIANPLHIVKHAGGRPTKYSEEMLIKANTYLSDCRAGKVIFPFIEELALILDVDEDTVANWCKAKNEYGEPRFPEFFGAIKKLKTLQKLRLMQRILGRYNPSGGIFLLKALHGMVEEERRIIANKVNEPLVIEIVGEKKGS